MKKKSPKVQRKMVVSRSKLKSGGVEKVEVDAGLVSDTPTIVSVPVEVPTPVVEKEIATNPSVPQQIMANKSEDEEVPMEKRNLRIYWLGVGMAIMTLVITGLVLVVRIQTRVDKVNLTEESLPGDEELEVIPSVKPALIKSALNIEVLNGSGVRGLAGKKAKELEALGYGEVTVGNVDSASESRVIIKSDKISDTESLKGDLVRVLGLDVDVEEGLTGEADVRIILGSDTQSL